ncbi:LLM class flavin-dependent oxidoreductase [Rhabdothermincola salaria]|uniref:LLM class flavin-dependent oxidoreductase n=1 Tax=Rhabdothermincola salaria TaxID=2903142 RepID=UPI001E391C73|nr:LLM class flavin-dependent oxidoreductase [Rhabdothermincola salaria]MCD9624370.1 LLM class flavin-dependent oxidoreductase [Rhabdothermincola salaria]
MEISIGVVPGPDAVRLARVAEELGYDRVWMYDSAALYEDIWINLANVVQATSLDVGTAVLVPNLRHVMTTASAIATIERLAPGRLTCGFGTGLTARWVLDKPALTWATLRRYIEQLRTLLDGGVADIDGGQAQMIHRPSLAIPRPIETPLLVSALGPKGLGITKEMVESGVAAGLMDVAGEPGDFGRHVQMVSGTVLDPGESPGDPRAREAIGPWYVVSYHYVWTQFREALEGMPAGAEWLARVEADRPEGERHLAVHEGHVTEVTDRDRMVLEAATAEALGGAGWVGEADDIAARVKASEANGVTEVLYTPAGPDVEREMRAFAAAVIG